MAFSTLISGREGRDFRVTVGWSIQTWLKSLAAALATVRVSLGTVLGCVVGGHFL